MYCFFYLLLIELKYDILYIESFRIKYSIVQYQKRFQNCLIDIYFVLQIPTDFSPPNNEPVNGSTEVQNDTNNNFKNLTYSQLTPPHLPPLSETPALNLIYRERLPSPSYTNLSTLPHESHNYTTENKRYPTIPDSSETQNYPYPNQHDMVFTSESNSSSCLSDLRIDDEMKKSEEEKEEAEKPKPYKCEDCGKQFSQLRNYKYHR